MDDLLFKQKDEILTLVRKEQDEIQRLIHSAQGGLLQTDILATEALGANILSTFDHILNTFNKHLKNFVYAVNIFKGAKSPLEQWMVLHKVHYKNLLTANNADLGKIEVAIPYYLNSKPKELLPTILAIQKYYQAANGKAVSKMVSVASGQMLSLAKLMTKNTGNGVISIDKIEAILEALVVVNKQLSGSISVFTKKSDWVFIANAQPNAIRVTFRDVFGTTDNLNTVVMETLRNVPELTNASELVSNMEKAFANLNSLYDLLKTSHDKQGFPTKEYFMQMSVLVGELALYFEQYSTVCSVQLIIENNLIMTLNTLHSLVNQ
jgi:hypothetical protein